MTKPDEDFLFAASARFIGPSAATSDHNNIRKPPDLSVSLTSR
jgi:hypothetical protein